MNYFDCAFIEEKLVFALDEKKFRALLHIKERLDSFAGCSVKSIDEACNLMYAVDQYAFLSYVRNVELAYSYQFQFACDLADMFDAQPFPISYYHVLTRFYSISSDRIDEEFRFAVTDIFNLLP